MAYLLFLKGTQTGFSSRKLPFHLYSPETRIQGVKFPSKKIQCVPFAKGRGR